MSLCGIYKGSSCVSRITYDTTECSGGRGELYTSFGYTGGQQCVTLPAGGYVFELWGAQGGQGICNGSTTYEGGKGGYSTGSINLPASTVVYAYVGGLGCCRPRSSGGYAAGGWNGGGCILTCGSGGAGGGGTDIRIGGNTLCHRRIVAGGGGGTGWVCIGGVGGGCSGSSPNGGGGTQTSGGGASGETGCIKSAGSFGQGGVGGGNSEGGGGGGGGWYGGGGTGYYGGGGGGSGYVYTSSTCGNVPSGYCHCASYLLTNAYTCCGATSFPNTSGGTETGHAGCGCIKIYKAGVIICPVDYTEGYIGNCKIRPYIPPICCYGYTGSVQCVTLQPGIYCFQVWGASGGNSTTHGYCGGKGGYSAGKYTITGSAKTLYIYVGGQGSTVNTSGAVYGGWNGGGGNVGGWQSYGAGHMGTGGGATDISTLNCPMTTDGYYRYIRDTTSYNSRLIVAGGGGGAENATGQPGGGTDGGTYGGTQSGRGGVYTDSMSSYGCYAAGALGYGMSVWNTHCNHAMSAPGGGGYYGGGGNMCNGNCNSNNVYGGGGSGYIGGVTDGITCRGDSSFPAPGGGNETGHTGHGYVKITRIS